MSEFETLANPRAIDFPPTRESPAGEPGLLIDTLVRSVYFVNELAALPRKADLKPLITPLPSPILEPPSNKRWDVWSMTWTYVSTATAGTRRVTWYRTAQNGKGFMHFLTSDIGGAGAVTKFALSPLQSNVGDVDFVTLALKHLPIRFEPGWQLWVDDTFRVDPADAVSIQWEYTERDAI